MIKSILSVLSPSSNSHIVEESRQVIMAYNPELFDQLFNVYFLKTAGDKQYWNEYEQENQCLTYMIHFIYSDYFDLSTCSKDVLSYQLYSEWVVNENVTYIPFQQVNYF